MHPDNAALYAKIDSLEGVVMAARAVVAEFLDMSEGIIRFTPKSIQRLNTALYYAENNKKITFHKEATNGKKKV